MLVLGDAHADVPAHRRALLAAYDEADADVALQLGDLLYYDLPAPTWFIAGNNEDLDVIDALRAGETPAGVRNAHLLASTAVELEGRRIAGLSGNFAPTQFDKSRYALHGDRRRHFVREDVERARTLGPVDVLLCHEAPHGLLQYEHYDPGNRFVDELLGALRPSVCLVGHHHRHLERTIGDTHVVGLAPVWEAAYELDPDSLALERRPVPAREDLEDG